MLHWVLSACSNVVVRVPLTALGRLESVGLLPALDSRHAGCGQRRSPTWSAALAIAGQLLGNAQTARLPVRTSECLKQSDDLHR